MHSVGEEEPLGVDGEVLEIRAGAVAFIFIEDVLHRVPDRQVPLAVLVPRYVAAELGGLRKMVDILLLLQAEFIPSGYLETHYLQVGEFIEQVAETAVLHILFLLSAGAERSGCSDCNDHS